MHAELIAELLRLSKSSFQFLLWFSVKFVLCGVVYFFCEEVGVVKGVHFLSGEVCSVATALKVVEEVQEEVQEVKDE